MPKIHTLCGSLVKKRIFTQLSAQWENASYQYIRCCGFHPFPFKSRNAGEFARGFIASPFYFGHKRQNTVYFQSPVFSQKLHYRRRKWHTKGLRKSSSFGKSPLFIRIANLRKICRKIDGAICKRPCTDWNYEEINDVTCVMLKHNWNAKRRSEIDLRDLTLIRIRSKYLKNLNGIEKIASLLF